MGVACSPYTPAMDSGAQGRAKRIVVAPDSFGDTLTAVEAAAAITAGWTRSRPDDEMICIPQSDGGPGFVEVLASRFGEVVTETVSGPLGAAVSASWLLDERDGAMTGYIECASACGLHQLGGAPTPVTAWTASTVGVGSLVAAALARGCSTIVVGLGGSATTDGGRGLTEAFGGLASALARLEGVRLVAASDVENPLLGPDGAAAVFGPQKGADAATVARLEERLALWADELRAATGRDVAGLAGAGAAGGLGAVLLALGGQRIAGAAIVAEATGQDEVLASADLVITGEGKFDHQTLQGKVVAALTRSAAASGVPTMVFAGQVALTPAQYTAAGIGSAHSIVDHAGSVQVAMDDARAQLTGLAAQVAATWGPVS
ncbi:glycerate kinase [Gordonia jinhuaensis]|uniref:Glycerate kinase n=2 Tax=Gordonia jinhuaensis TaxID=1517702 RepID=A0A916SXU2_9ACTN|nr:hypothetical protein GCM10011489_03620 [Gordonia jinhuaensis]